MSRQLPLKLTYNNQLIADEKPYLPIIGNKIPSKQIATFDGLDALTFTQLTGTATGAYDNVKSYHGAACYKVSLADNSSASVALDFTAAPLDLTSLDRKQNGYAQINQTGKYGNLQDQLFLILNIMIHNLGSPSATQINIVLSNGTKTATLSSNTETNPSYADKYFKPQYILNNSTFTYAGGFVDSDFSNITNIALFFYSDNTVKPIFYLQDIFLAIPKVNSENQSGYDPTITDAYYPSISEHNSIFVSQLFGNDSNAGTTKQINSTSGPVKTIETAIPLALASALPYIVLLDSATYKPVALDGSYVGIQQGLTNNITIIADYLETPTLSAEPGLFDITRTGVRTGLRNIFYENTSASGTIRTVGAGGTYGTIGAAHTAAIAGDCIEIIDSATYNETLSLGKALTIQAAPGQAPIWEYLSGNTVLNTNGKAVIVNGIAFKGKAGTAEASVIIDTASYINDCSFINIGSASGASSAITYTGTSGNTFFNNCLFSNNGESFTAIKHASGAAGTLKITNCLGYMGTSNVNVFIQSAKATSNPLNIITVGCQSLSSYVANVSNAYFYFSTDTAGAAAGTNFYGYFNDTNEAIDTHGTAPSGFKSSIIFKYNNVHDAIISTFNSFFLFFNGFASYDNVIVQNNVFQNIGWTGVSPSLGQIINMANVFGAGNVSIINNFFNGCSAAVCMYHPNNGQGNNNVFNNCAGGVILYSSASYENSIFNNCQHSITVNDPSANHPRINNVILFNSPPSDPSSLISYGTLVTTAPGFTDPDNNNFGWPYNSPLETLPGLTPAIQGFFQTAFIAASGADLNLNFIDIEGFYNTTMLSAVSSATTARYCNINNNLIGKYNASGLVHCYNCFMTGNGQAIRENNSNIISQSTNKNNIIDTNGTGIMLLSGSDIEYNTIVNNNYGITNIFSGFYNQSNYMNKYVILKNNIVAKNAAWDYVGTLQTDYSIIPNRYFDSLPITNVNYVNTTGQHDKDGQPEIDAPDVFNIAFQTYTYFPNTIFNGFLSNSPAWQAASDTYLNGQGQTVNLNIGARNIPAISTQLDFAQYDLNYVGNIANGRDEFYALENPNEIKYILQPINNESYRQIDGQYFNDPTAYTKEIELNWITPGADSKLLDTGRAAFEGAFMSIWVVGLSMDSGVTFVYFKVDKGSSIEMSPYNFLYNDTQTEPYGNFKLHLIAMPDKFVITDYLTNNLGE